MTSEEIKYHKRQCKLAKKFKNPKGLTLMQIQHEYAKDMGFKSWKEFIEVGV